MQKEFEVKSISPIMWNDMIFSHTDEVTTLELSTCVLRVSDPSTPKSQLRMLLIILFDPPTKKILGLSVWEPRV